jgi:hypothetical protein
VPEPETGVTCELHECPLSIQITLSKLPVINATPPFIAVAAPPLVIVAVSASDVNQL